MVLVGGSRIKSQRYDSINRCMRDDYIQCWACRDRRLRYLLKLSTLKNRDYEMLETIRSHGSTTLVKSNFQSAYLVLSRSKNLSFKDERT